MVNFYTDAHPHTFEKCDKEFYSEDSLHGHVDSVHTAAHHQKCKSKDSLQKREVDVNDQLVVSGEPVLEIRKFDYEVTHPHTCEKCDKESYMVCREICL